MEVEISPPMSIKMVKTMSWELEKTSISTVDILETVVADTDVKNKSKFLGSKEFVGSWLQNLQKNKTKERNGEKITKLNTK